jgi:hypothetical protein
LLERSTSTKLVLVQAPAGYGKTTLMVANTRSPKQWHTWVIHDAIALIDDIAVTQITRTRWEERSHYAEIQRLKWWMLELKCDRRGAEQSYRASLD